MDNTWGNIAGSPNHIPDYAEDYMELTKAEIEALARKAELSDPFGIDSDNTYRKAG